MEASDKNQKYVEFIVKNDEIDQKQLKSVRQEFIALSELRLQRMESSLSPTQIDYLKLIPLLFHVNHPMLPGYVDKFTPCGLPNYTPSTLEKKIAKTVSQSFEYKPRAHLKYPIASLYLMGSMGTLGQSNASDIDLWICLAEPLEPSLLNKLNAKAQNIKNWLLTIGIEFNSYVVNLDDFSRNKKKKIEVDSCGNTQNYLLLDEFYRTAVWFAGRWLLWWLVPPGENYTEYAQRLVKQKHIDSADWIDFGEVKKIPASEYFSAALWQLYKAIESPYKSSVKLLVLEVYARLFPCAGVLSDEFKLRVHHNKLDEQDSDPYLLILLFAEKSLQDNPQRLEFLRRAFYLKANIKITGAKKRKPSWRYMMIAELVKGWGWNQTRLDYLNSRHLWNIAKVSDERMDLVRELTSSYHFLSNFARVQGVINKLTKTELLSLGRKLYAAFERRSGKIERLNNGIAKDVYESAITLREDARKGWQLYLGHINQNKLAINQPVYSGHSLFECLVWGVVNGVITATTRNHVYQVNDYLNRQLASEITRDIIKLLEKFRLSEAKTSFDKEAKISCLGIFVNTRSDPLSEEKQENLYRVTSQSDCFSWAENKINLASHFDVLLINSWGEITAKHYSGDAAWIEFFSQHKDFLNSMSDIPIYCRGLVQKDQVLNRVRDLLDKWKSLVASSQRNALSNQYIILVGKRYLLIDLFYEGITYKIYTSVAKLYAGLSNILYLEKPEVRIKFHVDLWAPLELFVKSVLKRRLSENLDLFIYQKNNRLVEVMVKSANGSIHFQSHKNINIEQIVGHYQQFFDKIQNRNLLNNGLLEMVNFLQFKGLSENNKAKFKQLESSATSLDQQFSLVQAIATQKHVYSAGFDLFTADASYYYVEHGEGVYAKLQNQLLSMRRKGNQYPLFLTDLDLSAIHNKVSIIEALAYKKMIEIKLNKKLVY